MWPIIGSLISGGASLLGSWFGSQKSEDNTWANIGAQQQAQQQSQAFNQAEAEKARLFNAEQAMLNRDFQSNQAVNAMQFSAQEADVNRQFQQQMSNTAYQRARQDMLAAGLNPILAARTGASTPSGSMASGVAASGSSASGPSASIGTPNMGFHNARHAFEGIGDAVSKAVSSSIQLKTFEKMVEEIANIQADTAKTKAMEGLVMQQQQTEKNETQRRGYEAIKSGYEIPGKQLSGEEAKAVLNMPAWLRDTLVAGSYSGGKVAGTLEALPLLGNSAKSIRSLFPSRSTTERTTTDTRGHGTSTFEERFRGGGY